MELRAMIGRDLDTCKRGPPLIKLMDYEHREDAVGGGGASNRQHTQTHTRTQCPSLYTGWMEPQSKIGHNLDTCKGGPPAN